jgi:hypothetical protein
MGKPVPLPGVDDVMTDEEERLTRSCRPSIKPLQGKEIAERLGVSEKTIRISQDAALRNNRSQAWRDDSLETEMLTILVCLQNFLFSLR